MRNLLELEWHWQPLERDLHTARPLLKQSECAICVAFIQRHVASQTHIAKLQSMKHILTLCIALSLAAPAIADPPDHAPAHGYRNKDKHKESRKYHGYTGV